MLLKSIFLCTVSTTDSFACAIHKTRTMRKELVSSIHPFINLRLKTSESYDSLNSQYSTKFGKGHGFVGNMLCKQQVLISILDFLKETLFEGELLSDTVGSRTQTYQCCDLLQDSFLRSIKSTLHLL